jgi:AraC-like DNA-binding protein
MTENAAGQHGRIGEPTTLNAIGRLIAEVLRDHYHMDPEPLFSAAGLDPSLMRDAGARLPRAKLMKLWNAAVDATGDPCIGLEVGFSLRPTSYHALGYSWMASHNLHEAMQRLSRYYRVIVTVPLEVNLTEERGQYALEVVYPDPRYPSPPVPEDSFLASIVRLCRTATNEDFAPNEVWLNHGDFGRADEYERQFKCPVRFDRERTVMFFDKNLLDAPLPGDNLDLVKANDKVVERYLDQLDPDRVATRVRELLIDLLPTGNANQKLVARRLNKSVSALQRRLSAEGTTFRDVQDETRRVLAEQYVLEGKYSISEIAYLLGFSDQANFSRAFKRWSGRAPSKYKAEWREGAPELEMERQREPVPR